MKYSKNSFLDNINNSFDEIQNTSLTDRVVSLGGNENYRPRLEDIKKFLASDVDLLEKKSKIIVIGGTNGKGETSHCLRQLLLEGGNSVMMWTSPHVLSITERFIINNELIDYKILAQEIDQIEVDSKKLGLSFYELLFSVFIKHATKILPDYIILEVGLGGRFDAVNIFKNPLCAITSISRDHTKILGNKLSEILFEKYGISRNGGRLLSAIDQKYLRESLIAWCQRDNINLSFVEGEDYKKRNQNLAQCLYSELTGRTIDSGPEWFVTKGRHEEIVFGDVRCVFVGAHNLDGHRKLLELLNHSVQNSCSDSLGNILLMSFSTGREDQIQDILKMYLTYPCLFESFNTTHFVDIKAMDADLIKNVSGKQMNYLEDWTVIFNEENKTKTIYITGSYYFIAAVQRFIFNSK